MTEEKRVTWLTIGFLSFLVAILIVCAILVPN